MTASSLRRSVPSPTVGCTVARINDEVMMKATNEVGRAQAEGSSQLRLALIELGRIEREIAALENRPYDPQEYDLLASLRSCRSALLRMADVWMRRRPPDARES